NSCNFSFAFGARAEETFAAGGNDSYREAHPRDGNWRRNDRMAARAKIRFDHRRPDFSLDRGFRSAEKTGAAGQSGSEGTWIRQTPQRRGAQGLAGARD